MTYESRVLAVLSEEAINQSLVIKRARMCTSACLATLLILEDLGMVDRIVYRTGKQGRPAILYRRRQTQQEAA